MELSGKSEAFESLGISVVGLLYDPPSQLDKFRQKFKVSLAILSDSDSTVIKELGILNEEMDPATIYYGVPYPGIFLVNHEGRIVRKFAEENYRERPLIDELLNAAQELGGALSP